MRGLGREEGDGIYLHVQGGGGAGRGGAQRVQRALLGPLWCLFRAMAWGEG